MPIGDTITQPIPVVGTAGTGYASQLVAFLQEVKARLESKIALTSLLAGLFDLANNGIANAMYVGLYEQNSLPSTPVGSLQRYGGELYYVSPSGAVRITNGGSLDVVSANGITGDYAAPAEFRYDLGALEYFAYSNRGAGEWARVGAQGFDIYGTLTSTTRVRLAWGGGSSWTLTLPAAPPGSKGLVFMDASGNLSASSTVDVPTTFTSNITLSGGATIKHGTRTMTCVPRALRATGAGVTTGDPGDGTTCYNIVESNTTADFEIGPFDRNKTIKAIRVYHTGPFGGAAATVTAYRVDSSATFTSLGSSVSPASPISISVGGGSGQITNGYFFVVRVVTTTGKYPIQYIEVDYEET